MWFLKGVYVALGRVLFLEGVDVFVITSVAIARTGKYMCASYTMFITARVLPNLPNHLHGAPQQKCSCWVRYNIFCA